MSRLSGSQAITGYGQNVVVRDTRGDTNQYVGGASNRVKFKGDKGANTFFLGGVNNRVKVKNLGSDDAVVLEGNPQDWQRLPDRNSRDGKVRYYNSRTNTYVKIKTDGRRGDAFVDQRVHFTGGYNCNPNQLQPNCGQHHNSCAANSWDQLGQFTQMAHMLQVGMMLGEAMSRHRSQQRSQCCHAQWGQSQSLGFDPWGSLLRLAMPNCF